jgi:hypothetical protein
MRRFYCANFAKRPDDLLLSLSTVAVANVGISARRFLPMLAFLTLAYGLLLIR